MQDASASPASEMEKSLDVAASVSQAVAAAYNIVWPTPMETEVIDVDAGAEPEEEEPEVAIMAPRSAAPGQSSLERVVSPRPNQELFRKPRLFLRARLRYQSRGVGGATAEELCRC
ncbi:hypothetical protein GQ55_8G137600 [Panicum hallii var. hallii]|uniref:Uncharacterized protein n=1 Tax=Panicum hallii var. hallii TaxID=1504633 RepID=A0A2T7CN17_9POAL|nr:hypothetical protein GQ55_8G137600 [Panicum hallii var. hallii]